MTVDLGKFGSQFVSNNKEFNRYIKLKYIKFFFLLSTFLLLPHTYFAKEYNRSFIIWGTNFDLQIKSNLDKKSLNLISEESVNILNRLNIIFNNYQKLSEITIFNESKINSEISISPEFVELLIESKKYHEISDGYFDITIGNLTSKFDYKNVDKSIQIKKNQFDCSGWENILLVKNNSALIKKKNCINIDFGGIAEGYALKKIIKFINQSGIDDAIINFGGNISTLSKNQDWEVYINYPSKEPKPFKKIKLNNLSISTSSLYGKSIKINGDKMSHIFNPKNKLFLKYKNLSVSVISDDPIYADAMSTALISMDYSDMEAFIEKNNIKVIVLGEKDGKGEVLYISDGI